MASLNLASIFSYSYRSFSAPVTLLRTLAFTRAYSLNKKALVWCSLSKRKLSCESLKQDIACTTATSSVNGYPEYTRLLPCPSHNSPPRIEHLVVSEEGPVLDYICKALDLPPLSNPFWSCTLCPCMPTATSNSNS